MYKYTRKEETMAQLWGGRFTKETDQLVYRFNASIGFDQKFYAQDIEGSIAHVTMLGKVGILTEEETQAIIACLRAIKADVDSGKLIISDTYEDIQRFVEANLIERSGSFGYASLYKTAGVRDRCTSEGVIGYHSSYYGGKYGYHYAGLYPFTEGAANYPCTSYGGIF